MANVADFLIGRMRAWGVSRIYGYPGDGVNGLVTAIGRTHGAIEFVQVRHEEQAALMACAHAKFTGDAGVALATSGPGAIHLLNGLYDAKMDHVPVVAIVGQAATSALGGSYMQEVDLEALFKDVAGAYLVTVTNPVQVRHAVDRAMRTALARRTVTAIIVPKDVAFKRAVEEPPHAHNTLHSSVGYASPRIVPADIDLRRTAQLLDAGERVAMLVGAGALHATDELIAVADRLGAGCAKALLGKAALPDDLPWVTGTIGLLGTRASAYLMSECDTLLMVGTSFPYAEFLPKPGQARGVQIDIDPHNLGLRYATEINLAGDAAATLRELLPLLEQKSGVWRDRLAHVRAEAERVELQRAELPGHPINPGAIFTALSDRLPDDCIIAGDAGTSTNWLARHLKMRRGMKFSLSGGLATMGSAVAYAIAAKFAFPGRPVIALTGDGAMQMNGLNELLTVVKYRRRWRNEQFIVMVNNNRDLNQVTWEMRIDAGDPKFDASQSLPDFPYAQYAEMLGFTGIRCERQADVGRAWDAALAARGPVVLEMITDPNISLLPPHITFDQAKNFATALLKGDPDEGAVLADAARSLLAGFLTGATRRPSR